MTSKPKGKKGPGTASQHVLFDMSNMPERRSLHAYGGVTFWLGSMCFYFFMVPCGGFIWLYYLCPQLLYVILPVLLASLLLPIRRGLQPKILMRLGNWAMHGAAKYFRLKVIADDYDELKKCNQAIFAMEPHDVLPLGIFSFNKSLNVLPSYELWGCITGACFKIPIMKHVYTWCSAVSVDKKSIKSMLRRGISPCICPGGVQEVTLLDRSKKECVLFLKKRFGFIKLALEYGTPIVPCFVFGHDKSFDCWVPKNKLLQKMGRKIGFLPMAFFGAFGIPFGPPKPCDYVNVVGSPIPVPKIPNPTEEDIKKVQDVFLAKMVDLFERNKAAYGYGEITLRLE